MTSFKPFFQHIVKHGEQRHRTIKLSSPQPRPRVLTAAEAQTILDACDHLRDRLLFALLLDAGMRIGEALGLRHEDLDIAGCQVAVVSRVNDNRARVKGGRPRFIPTSGELIRLYADYLNVEYGALDSDYVFVNLWGRPHGHPLSYPAVYDLVGRLRRRTGVDFSPHWFRHTYATWLLRRGGGDGKRQGAARPCLDRHHRRHLRPPHRRGCPRDVGGRRLVHRNRGPVVNRTSTSAEPGRSTWPGLLEKLMRAVRSEFRVDLYVPDPDHPVLGRGCCSVTGCDRSPSGNRLCPTHQKRWIDRGRPELAEFLSDPGPPLNGRRDLTGCTVPGCRYGSSGLGLCMRHRSAWTTSRHPDPVAWAAAAAADAADSTGRRSCGLPFCSLRIDSERNRFCKAQQTRWRMQGRPDVEGFVSRCLLTGRDRIDFSGVPPLLKLELQYAVQCRADAATIMLPAPVVNWAIRQARDAAVSSLLDHPAPWWADRAGPKTNSYPAFLAFARDVVETLDEGTGWEVEYPRDIWRLERLPGLTPNPGKASSRHRLRFDQIPQPWLREPVKRWARLRLSSGLAVGTVVSDVKALRRFSGFLTEAAPETQAVAGLDRALLERYLAWLATAGLGPGAREDAVTCLGMFFQALRQHGWEPSLPTTAVFLFGDLPRRSGRVTRHLAEHVMAQVEAAANLDRSPNPEGRLVTLILIQAGLRAIDACTLAFDCLLHDGQGAPYLRYVNNKMRREAAVPIDADLEAEIRAQQQRVAARWPDQHPHLFSQRKGNAGGQRPLSYYSYRGMLNAWLTLCEVHDEHGDPVHLTPHQWRHAFACRLINRDVPQEVIRVLLDHESTQMTAHYARITDQTVRRRWEQATKVNINGERVDIDPEGPLGQAQWAKTRYGMATQTLPHGYCGLPVQKSCPHANACLTCPVFLTGPEFLPELHEHRGRTLTLIDKAEAAGHTRVAQMNTEVLTNLEKMIGQIEQEPAGTADAS